MPMARLAPREARAARERSEPMHPPERRGAGQIEIGPQERDLAGRADLPHHLDAQVGRVDSYQDVVEVGPDPAIRTLAEIIRPIGEIDAQSAGHALARANLAGMDVHGV